MTDDATVMSPHAPRFLGKYRLDQELGRGGMGVVYRAYDPVIERTVALKTIHRELARGEGSEEFLARFRREIRAAGRCNHPNIVAVHDSGEAEGTPFLVMEFVSGEPLSRRLRDGQSVSLAVVRVVMMQLLAALDCAHGQGVIHRDIKPANLMLQANGRLKVADFGVASLSNSQSQTQHTIGTPSYMAPEQFTGELPTPVTDLYAAGVVLFELLCGHLPYRADNAAALMYQVMHTPLPDVPHSVPSALRAVVRKAIQRDPAARFPSAKAFGYVLKSALEGHQEALSSTSQAISALPGATPLDPNTVNALQDQLMSHVGPIARHYVKAALVHSTTVEAFKERLAQHIPNAQERTRFMGTATPNLTTSRR